MTSEAWLLCSKPSPIPSVMKITWVFWMWWERNGPFGQRPTQVRKQTLTHTLFPPVEKLQAEWVSPGTEPCHFGGGVTQVIKTVPLTHFNAPTLGSSCPTSVLKLLLDSKIPRKMLLSVCGCQNWCSLTGKIEICILASCWCHSIFFLDWMYVCI